MEKTYKFVYSELSHGCKVKYAGTYNINNNINNWTKKIYVN